MPCETASLPNQTLNERKSEIRKAVDNLASLLASGKVTPKIGPTGGVAFVGWSDRNRVTDNCAFRMIMSTGSAFAKQAILTAERLAGKSVNRKAVAHGHHAHSDGSGGLTWHNHKG
jgi:hypothetical protein